MGVAVRVLLWRVTFHYGGVSYLWRKLTESCCIKFSNACARDVVLHVVVFDAIVFRILRSQGIELATSSDDVFLVAIIFFQFTGLRSTICSRDDMTGL